MKKKLVFTVGNEMMGDDAAGPLLTQMLIQSPLDGWVVLDGGNAPENYVFKIREMAPDEVVIVDAADMKLQGGEIRLIDRDQIGEVVFMTTHALPLTYLMDAIHEFVPSVKLIGVQPEIVAFNFPISPRVRQAIEHVYAWLKQDGDRSDLVIATMGTFLQAEPNFKG